VDFDWSSEQLALRDSVIAFARQALQDDLVHREREGGFPRALWARCAEFGIQGLPFPEEYGGGGADPLTAALAMEALGSACRDGGLLFGINAQMWSVQMPILTFGTAEQRRRYLAPLCAGTLIGAHGMSEPGSGSDAFALRTVAERRGGCYVLNGSKTFVTNAPVADLFLVFATVERAKGVLGVTAFLVDRDSAGLRVGPTIEKMGLKTSPMAEVVFEECIVPAENILGREGRGASIFNDSMEWERSCLLATILGAMVRQLDECVRYARERQQFGKPIGEFQLVQAMLADSRTEAYAARCMVVDAARRKDAGEQVSTEASCCKLFASEMVGRVADRAVQIHGGAGYIADYGVERFYRDVRLFRLYEGTSQIQQIVIARNMLREAS